MDESVNNTIPPTLPDPELSKYQPELPEIEPPKRKKLKLMSLALVVIVALGIGAVFILKPFDDKQESADKPSKDKGQLVVTTDKQQLDGLDSLEITATFTNNDENPAVFSFNSGCNEPDFLVNGKNLNGPSACTLALTEVTIPGNSQKTWKRSVPSSKIAEGELTVQAKWYGYESNVLTVTKILSEADKAKQNNCPKLKTPERYCTQLAIMPTESISRAEMEKKLSPLKIRLLPTPKALMPENPDGEEYTFFVQVPPDQKQDWITKIQSKAGLVTEDDSIFGLQTL